MGNKEPKNTKQFDCTKPISESNQFYVGTAQESPIEPFRGPQIPLALRNLSDEMSPERRRMVIAHHDQQHDPANAEENEFWFNNACGIVDVEREIAKRELLPERTALDVEAKERLLSGSRKRLHDLKSEQFKPLTVDAAASETPASDEQDEIRKRAVLIAEVGNFWPTIEQDLSDANRNGLHGVAKHDTHGFWRVKQAIKWATERGKVSKGKAQSFIASNEESYLSPMLRILLKLD